jgi:hypothetical protein
VSRRPGQRPGRGPGGIDLTGVIVDDTLKTRPDLEEVTCDDDKADPAPDGRPVLAALLFGFSLLIGGALLVCSPGA